MDATNVHHDVTPDSKDDSARGSKYILLHDTKGAWVESQKCFASDGEAYNFLIYQLELWTALSLSEVMVVRSTFLRPTIQEHGLRCIRWRIKHLGALALDCRNDREG